MTVHVSRHKFTFRWQEWTTIGEPSFRTEFDILAADLQSGNIYHRADLESEKIKTELKNDLLDKLPIRNSPPAITSG